MNLNKDFLWGYAYGIAVSLVMIFVLPRCSKASEFKLIDHKETSIDFKNYLPNGYDPVLPQGSSLNKGVNLHVNTDLVRYMYWNNTVWSLADQTQFRAIGWNYMVGVRLLPFLNIEYEHFSKHILDKPGTYQLLGEKYPVSDSINFTIFLYRKNREDTVW